MDDNGDVSEHEFPGKIIAPRNSVHTGFGGSVGARVAKGIDAVRIRGCGATRTGGIGDLIDEKSLFCISSEIDGTLELCAGGKTVLRAVSGEESTIARSRGVGMGEARGAVEEESGSVGIATREIELLLDCMAGEVSSVAGKVSSATDMAEKGCSWRARAGKDCSVRRGWDSVVGNER